MGSGGIGHSIRQGFDAKVGEKSLVALLRKLKRKIRQNKTISKKLNLVPEQAQKYIIFSKHQSKIHNVWYPTKNYQV